MFCWTACWTIVSVSVQSESPKARYWLNRCSRAGIYSGRGGTVLQPRQRAKLQSFHCLPKCFRYHINYTLFSVHFEELKWVHAWDFNYIFPPTDRFLCMLQYRTQSIQCCVHHFHCPSHRYVYAIKSQGNLFQLYSVFCEYAPKSALIIHYTRSRNDKIILTLRSKLEKVNFSACFDLWSIYFFIFLWFHSLLFTLLLEPGFDHAALLHYITQHAPGGAQEGSGDSGGCTFPYAVRWIPSWITSV